ncbi:MAG TPA: hypothetical protein VHK27_05740 [Gammaproteobacteria bacterium]|nr:hypothetical protein [Gammaproteobacteria bacterium]
MSHAYKQESGTREQQDWLARAAAEQGHSLPSEALDEAPDLREDLSFYLQAYHELSTVRPVAFSGIAPLPYDKVIEYAERHKLDEEEFEDFCEIINGLDAKFREFLTEESEAKTEANENDGKGNKSHNRPRDRSRRGKGRR